MGEFEDGVYAKATPPEKHMSPLAKMHIWSRVVKVMRDVDHTVSFYALFTG